MQVGPQKGPNLKRKPLKVYLSKEEFQMLDRVCQATGEDRSTLARSIILNHLKELNLVREAVHHG